MQRADVAVVGAGAIGAAVALWLTRRGASVLVIDRGPEWGSGCSLGNAGWICPGHAGPFARRSEVVDALRWLTRRDSPFAIRPDPRLVPWLLALAQATSDARVAEVTEVTRRMAQESLDLHRSLAAEGLDTGFRQLGLLDVHHTADGWTRAQRAADHHVRLGADLELLGPDETLAQEPALSAPVAGSVHFRDDAHCDPARFSRALGAAALAEGARLCTDRTVRTVLRTNGRLRLIADDMCVEAESVVLAAGVGSTRIARTWGEKLPLVSGKGYSVDFVPPAGATVPRQPLMLVQARVAVTPLAHNLRLAGTMEIGGRADGIAPGRVAAITRAGGTAIPSLGGLTPTATWYGLRPCTPTGLPILRRSTVIPGVVLATGHAMLGITLAPVTGRLVADLLAA